MRLLHEPLFGGRTAPNAPLLAAITAAGTLAMHIFVPAMPAAAVDLAVPAGTMQLAITLYVVGIAVGQLFFGPLSDRFGRRPVLLAGLALYLVATVVAAVAESAGVLIAARVFQALGACGGLVLGRAMLRDGTTADQAARKLALLTLATMVAPATAPAIGGFLTVWFSWRAIFVLLAGIGLVVFVLSILMVPETNRRRVPLRGFATMIRSYGRLMRLRAFSGFAVGGACSTTSIYAFLSVSPFLFIDVLHRTADEIGLYYLVLIGGTGVGMFVASRLAGRLSLRSAARFASWISIVGAAGLLLAQLTETLNVVTVMLPMSIFAIGAGLASPNALAGAISADPQAIGAASGLYGFVQMSFGAICTLIVGLWHADSALPVALVLVASTVLAQIAFTLAPKHLPTDAA